MLARCRDDRISRALFHDAHVFYICAGKPSSSSIGLAGADFGSHVNMISTSRGAISLLRRDKYWWQLHCRCPSSASSVALIIHDFCLIENRALKCYDERRTAQLRHYDTLEMLLPVPHTRCRSTISPIAMKALADMHLRSPLFIGQTKSSAINGLSGWKLFCISMARMAACHGKNFIIAWVPPEIDGASITHGGNDKAYENSFSAISVAPAR